MAVKMRLMRMGKKKSAQYRVVVVDARAPRDGRYIDLIGRYDPNQDPSLIEIDNDKAVDWLRKGVQPTESVVKLLQVSGAMARFKVASGAIHTVPGQGPGTGPVETETPAEEPPASPQAAESPAPAADTEETTSPPEPAEAAGSEEE